METDAVSPKNPPLSSALQSRGLMLAGCGRMGGALLQGWLSAGAAPRSITVVDPHLDGAEADRLRSQGVRVTAAPPSEGTPLAALVLAVKPQIMEETLPAFTSSVDAETLIVSVAAGLPIALFEAAAPGAAVIRAMPNTPASIGEGITALIANERTGTEQRALGEALAAVVGEVVWLDHEEQMDAVTAVSGSGPAYVFHMIEALAAAGRAEGLPEDLAMRLARATIAGAGALASQSPDSAETLRRNVTSPGGTTAAGLQQLMAEKDGLTPLLVRTIAAAARRSRELGQA